jgi:hypothetical protein
LEPHHTHPRLSGIVLTNGKVTRRMNARTAGSLLGLFSDGKAVLRRDSSIVLLDLANGKETVLAQAQDATVWFRDLRQKTRIKPVATAWVRDKAPGLVSGVYRWVMKDPTDFVVKPEYQKKSGRANGF